MAGALAPQDRTIRGIVGNGGTERSKRVQQTRGKGSWIVAVRGWSGMVIGGGEGEALSKNCAEGMRELHDLRQARR
jgi:hypothetical protein